MERTTTILTHNCEYGPVVLLWVTFNKEEIDGLNYVFVYDPSGCQNDVCFFSNNKPQLLNKHGEVELVSSDKCLTKCGLGLFAQKEGILYWHVLLHIVHMMKKNTH